VTFAKFQRLQIAERNEFLLDAIRAHDGNLTATAQALHMNRFVLCRFVKRYGLVENYGRRRWIEQAAA
jgi:transcriptional regulator of acetoin/glycerol metabolism